jgi:hypothetical protein
LPRHYGRTIYQTVLPKKRKPKLNSMLADMKEQQRRSSGKKTSKINVGKGNQEYTPKANATMLLTMIIHDVKHCFINPLLLTLW